MPKGGIPSAGSATTFGTRTAQGISRASAAIRAPNSGKLDATASGRTSSTAASVSAANNGAGPTISVSIRLVRMRAGDRISQSRT